MEKKVLLKLLFIAALVFTVVLTTPHSKGKNFLGKIIATISEIKIPFRPEMP